MKTLFVLALSLFTTPAFAGAAVIYNCLGADAISGNSVAFELAFTDHGREEGYTNQSITIEKVGFEKLEQPVVFQMYGATKRNSCQRNGMGEIYLNQDLDMTPTGQGDIAAYTVKVNSPCDGAKYDIKAYCLFQ